METMERECWTWTGPQDSNGYSRARVTWTKKTISAHRAAWISRYGPLPENWHLHHKCRNKLCYNPLHMQAMHRTAHMWVEYKENPSPYGRHKALKWLLRAGINPVRPQAETIIKDGITRIPPVTCQHPRCRRLALGNRIYCLEHGDQARDGLGRRFRKH